MKVILKQGRDGFIATCRKCGCEFKYALSDIIIDRVYCPYCDNPVYHPDQSLQDIMSWSETKRLIEHIKNGGGLPPIPDPNTNRKGFQKIK